VIVENAVDIRRSAEEVFDYCTDIVRESDWNPRTRRVVAKLTDGPIGLGTRFDGEWIKSDPMVIEYVHFDRPTRWVSVGRSASLDIKSEGEVSATKDGVRLTVSDGTSATRANRCGVAVAAPGRGQPNRSPVTVDDGGGRQEVDARRQRTEADLLRGRRPAYEGQRPVPSRGPVPDPDVGEPS
jgi:hypothetical protein